LTKRIFEEEFTMSDKKLITLAVLGIAICLLVAGCARGPSRTAYEGGTVGAGVGAVAGALIDDDNRWRGGVIGGALGAVLGGALGEISDRAANEAAYQRQPVAYSNQSGTQRLEAQPMYQSGNCQMVREKYYKHGRLVKVTEREVCN
jgi:hypothetical protein